MAKDKSTYIDIARDVFEKYGEKKPMHYEEIAAKAAGEGWLADGAGQAEALLAAVRGDIADKGRDSLFVTHGQEYLGLRKWMWHGFAAQIHDHNTLVYDMLRKKLLAMDAGQFAACVERLLEAMNFENLTRETGADKIIFRGTLVAEDVIEIPTLVWAVMGEDEIDAQKFLENIPENGRGLLILRAENKAQKLFEKHPLVGVLDQEKLIAKLIDKEIADL